MDSDSVPVYRRGPSRSSVEALEEFTTDREASLRVPCRDCRAVVGEPCRNTVTGLVLQKFAAHDHRKNDARKQEAV